MSAEEQVTLRIVAFDAWLRTQLVSALRGKRPPPPFPSHRCVAGAFVCRQRNCLVGGKCVALSQLSGAPSSLFPRPPAHAQMSPACPRWPNARPSQQPVRVPLSTVGVQRSLNRVSTAHTSDAAARPCAPSAEAEGLVLWLAAGGDGVGAPMCLPEEAAAEGACTHLPPPRPSTQNNAHSTLSR